VNGLRKGEGHRETKRKRESMKKNNSGGGVRLKCGNYLDMTRQSKKTNGEKRAREQIAQEGGGETHVLESSQPGVGGGGNTNGEVRSGGTT